MALIKCPECGQDVSDQAEICVNCGVKIAGTKNLQELAKKKEAEIIQKKKDRNKSVISIIIMIAIIAFAGCFIWYQKTADDRTRQRLMDEIQDSLNELQESQDEIDDLERQLEHNNYLIEEYEKNN